MAKSQNTFSNGFNMDITDFLLPNNTLRNCKNIRITDIDGTTFAAVNIPGNTGEITAEKLEGERFKLKEGYFPVAAKEHTGILYIVSANFDSNGDVINVELGTFPSPNYIYAININHLIWEYRPLDNLVFPPHFLVTDFNTDILFDFNFLTFVDLELQFKYDNSINYIIVIDNNLPRIINSGFTRNNGLFELLPDSYYNIDTLLDTTPLVPASTQMPKVEFNEIVTGGKLKPGNYQYAFAYLDSNFNETDIVVESKTCAVMFGDKYSDEVKGGTQNEETDRLVKLTLTNIDPSFKYIQVYFQYSSGTESTYTAIFKFNVPILNHATINFTHTGYEQVTEVTSEVLNVEYSAIASASVECQTKNYLLLGDIKQTEIDWTEYAALVETITPTLRLKTLDSVKAYSNPANVYNFMSERRAETAPYGIVFIMNTGVKSPVFPITGVDMTLPDPATTPSQMQKMGLIRFPTLFQHGYKYEEIIVLGLDFNLGNIQANPLIADNTSGYFIVRGTRIEDAIAQGYLVPTFKAPITDGISGELQEYDDNDKTIEQFKNVPAFDSIIEGHLYLDAAEDNRHYVVKKNLEIDMGYMLGTICDEYVGKFDNENTSGTGAGFRIYNKDKWAFYSSEAILNEPEFITKLHDRNLLSLTQVGKIEFEAECNLPWQIEPYYKNSYNDVGYPIKSEGITGTKYEFRKVLRYSTPLTLDMDAFFIPAENRNSINTFSSGVVLSMREYMMSKNGYTQNVDRTGTKALAVHSSYNAYFGIDVIGMKDTEPASGNPIGAARRISDGTIQNGRPGNGTIRINVKNDEDLRSQVCLLPYDNGSLGDTIRAAFIVNIYPRTTGMLPNPSVLYPSIDIIAYKRVSDNLIWAIDGTASVIYGGDTYIGSVFNKLSQPGPDYRDSSLPDTNTSQRRNIDMGILVELVQETKYNPAMRVEYAVDEMELEKRTFFPYRDSLPNDYREYRYPDTVHSTVGSAVLYPPKARFSLSSSAPYFKFSFFTRIMHSERDIPNAFANNYRVFEGNNYRDYDTAMGKITRLVEYRDNTIIVFEQGIAVATIEQRMQTANDELGGVFVEPKSVLPPNIAFFSKEIGSQNPYSVIRTPGAVYGFDVKRQKIWQLTEQLKVISDTGFISFLKNNMNNDNFRIKTNTGYDPELNEVLFTYTEYSDEFTISNQWTLVYKEGLERFTYFFTGKPHFYARRNNEFYSFGNKDESNLKDAKFAFKHNNYAKNEIYGEFEESYLEFIVNESPNSTKVIDYLNLVSNEVAPLSIELYTYDKDSLREETIDTDKTFQYIKIEQGIDFFTEEPIFRLRDRSYKVQIPVVQIMKQDDLEKWAIDSRLRNKIIIIRVTYDSVESVELLSIITNFRNSIS